MVADERDTCLLVERRVLADETRAVVPARAADALRVVVCLVATLVVHEAGEAETAVQHVDSARQGELTLRRRVAEEDVRVSDEELARRGVLCRDVCAACRADDAVTVLVFVAGVDARPPSVERVAFDLRLGGS